MRKLADIHGEEAMQLTALLVNLGCKVSKDKTFNKYFHTENPDRDVLTSEFLNALLLRYRKDCIKMLAEIEGTAEKNYLETLTPVKLTSDIGELMSDSDFYDLFFASVQSP